MRHSPGQEGHKAQRVVFSAHFGKNVFDWKRAKRLFVVVLAGVSAAGGLTGNAYADDVGFLAGYWCVPNGKNGMRIQIVSDDRVRESIVTPRGNVETSDFKVQSPQPKVFVLTQPESQTEQTFVLQSGDSIRMTKQVMKGKSYASNFVMQRCESSDPRVSLIQDKAPVTVLDNRTSSTDTIRAAPPIGDARPSQQQSSPASKSHTLPSRTTDSGATITLVTCNGNPPLHMFSLAVVVPPKGFDFDQYTLAGEVKFPAGPWGSLSSLFMEARKMIDEECPGWEKVSRASSSVLFLYQMPDIKSLDALRVNGFLPDPSAVSVSIVLPPGSSTAFIYNNHQQRKAEQAKKNAEENKNAELDARAKKFLEKNGFKRLSDLDAVVTNPFALEGQNVMLFIGFSRMLTATQGLFADRIVVSEIPRGRFKTSMSVVLVGKVLGNIEVKTSLGSTQLVHLEFVDAYDCPYVNIRACPELFRQIEKQ